MLLHIDSLTGMESATERLSEIHLEIEPVAMTKSKWRWRQL